ncbi:MAG TPA: glutamate--tRNA ligase [Firmicutes bacterium]|nr:glutamate--tRNA ligase [Bacillota bacterium]
MTEKDTTEKVRVRFAPSPTGHLHIGNAHTGLFNWLFARHNGGKFILRIEDTDLERSYAESEKLILEDLKWLGLDWDEGVDIGGPYGPYRQTERLELYRQYAQRLLDEGHAYLCYCTPEELEMERKAALDRGEAPRYGGRCRELTEARRAELERQGRRPAVRFRVPDEVIVVNDLIRGPIEFDSKTIGDFVIMKCDGVPTYNFAVVVDDVHMKITHIIRADEHVANTPRQILLYEALGLPLPKFAHISMILGPDRTKLSKRHGATSVFHYRQAGYLPDAVVNYLALLGWSPENGEEVLTREELVKQFSLDRVGKSPAVFDIAKLNWLNGVYIRQADLKSLTGMAIPYLKNAGLVSEPVTGERFDWLMDVVDSVRGYLDNLSQIPEHAGVFFGDRIDIDDGKARKIISDPETSRVLNLFIKELESLEPFDREAIHTMLLKMPAQLGLSVRKTLMPVRVALTGTTAGPELPNVIFILGRDRSIGRARQALHACS